MNVLTRLLQTQAPAAVLAIRLLAGLLVNLLGA